MNNYDQWKTRSPDDELEGTIDAEGIVITEIHCPKCDYLFTQEGNCDRIVLECPNCLAPLCVRSK